MLSALCLTLAIYHEARGEPLTGQYLVGQVVLNRAAHPKYPDDICAVVFQPYQFSFTSLKSLSMDEGESLNIAWAIAADLLSTYDQADDLLFFYNPRKARPSWAREFEEVITVGNHRFMKP
jgi:N-acetylmuramoyl-L-alanine amidase